EQAGIGNAPLHERVDQQIFLFSGLNTLGVVRFDGLQPLVQTDHVFEWRRQFEVQAGFGKGIADFTQGKDQSGIPFTNNENTRRKYRQENDQANYSGEKTR